MAVTRAAPATRPPSSTSAAAGGGERAAFVTTASIVAIVLLAGLAAVFRTDDTDLWFHLAAGRAIIAHGLPSVERWVVSAAGEKPWLPGWAFHPPLWLVYHAAGFVGLALWRALFSAAAVALALGVARV